jgi:misacylated tRNA(Ala) deacylase
VTERIYAHDADSAYAHEMDALVVESDPTEKTVVLDATVFYPTGGGQPHDIGAIRWDDASSSVVEVRSAGDDVVHRLDGPVPSSGTPVRGEIDWERRYLLMRTHSALHVLCGVIWRDHGAMVTGGNMEPGEGRMDFELESWDPPAFAKEVEERLQAEVAADRPIGVRHLPRAEAFEIPDLIRTKVNLLPQGIEVVRVIDILGLDVQADGGTHVRSTGEIGKVRVAKTESKGRANKRLRIALDR